MRSKCKLIIFCGLVLILIAAICLLVFVEFAGRLDESDTTQLVATVTEVICDDFENQDNIKIYTEEYNNSFLISSIVTSNIDFDTYKAITMIQKGEKICLKIEKNKDAHINKVDFIDVVSLSTEETEIFSIDDYNEYHHKASLPGKLMCTLLIISSIILLIIMWIKRQRNGLLA